MFPYAPHAAYRWVVSLESTGLGEQGGRLPPYRAAHTPPRPTPEDGVHTVCGATWATLFARAYTKGGIRITPAPNLRRWRTPLAVAGAAAPTGRGRAGLMGRVPAGGAGAWRLYRPRAVAHLFQAPPPAW